jgi:hypothetical protein
LKTHKKLYNYPKEAKRARGAVEVQGGAEVGEAAATAPSKLTTRGHEIKRSRKFE